MPKLVVTRNVGPDAMAILEASPFQLIVNPNDTDVPREWVLKHIADPEVHGIIIMHSQPNDKVDEEFLETCNPNLKVISTFSVGFDHIDVKGAQAKGIKVGHTPGVLDDAVADITAMLVLMTMRRVEEGITLVKSGGWPQLPWAPFVMCGPSISHPNLTISFLGFGRIAQVVLSRLLAFTSKSAPPTILYQSSRARPNQLEIDENLSKEFGVSVKRVEKDELGVKADILIVLCSLSPATKDFINLDFLKKMKKSAVLINCARGPVVNSEDLAVALETGEIFGAGLDVITGEPNISGDHPLVKSPKCIVLPHMGSGEIDTRKKMAELSVRNCLAGALGEPLPAEIQL